MSDASRRAYLTIRQSILVGDFSTGDRLVESELVSICGVSRTPIREALRRLASEGMVNITRNSGATVATWSEQEFADLYDVRTHLEGMAASLAATRRTDEDLELLESAAHAMAEHIADFGVHTDPNAISRTNRDFHGAVLKAARSRALSLAAAQVMDAPLMLRTFRRYTQEQLSHSLAQHREILEAIRVGDPEWANAAMIGHIRRGYQVLVQAPVVLSEIKK